MFSRGRLHDSWVGVKVGHHFFERVQILNEGTLFGMVADMWRVKGFIL
jgi:hypothetical protein